MSAGSDFWTRRRAAVVAEERAEAAALSAEARAQAQAALEQESDEDILARLELPDPDTLQPGDDVARFMSDLVPDRLRRRALRRLWRLNPVLANVDGLVDYGEDYTDAALVVENLQTAYQVGKGMLAHIEALAAQAKGEEDTGEEDLPATTPDETEEAPLVLAETSPPEMEAASAADAGNEVVPLRDPEAPALPAPRRMRFSFEG
ncbi:DUF3306 domain-containing protein [Ruegeria aquimaris]|uniref:DUF3306 domain-containing protein n=1 Tax=Ruegeria aquimaris TaxID=2984333 RepID=A0ABT3ADR0_9RHOB|nr:DUF3306 domain-containing protein [Ruegeria sp. XHP0148]MCV2886780.1 DUF3306 domain-containing protein [Ruegeria sp. XHP0148]